MIYLHELFLFFVGFLLTSNAEEVKKREGCTFESITSLTNKVMTDYSDSELEEHNVSSLVSCYQKCCQNLKCKSSAFVEGKGYKKCVVYYQEIWKYEGGLKDAEEGTVIDYRRMYVPGYRAEKCPKGTPCLLNVESWVWPTLFGNGPKVIKNEKGGEELLCTLENNEPFLKQIEYVMPLDKCSPGMGFNNIIECVKPGVIAWTRFDSEDTKCRKSIAHHVMTLKTECIKGILKPLWHNMVWGPEGECFPCAADDYKEKEQMDPEEWLAARQKCRNVQKKAPCAKAGCVYDKKEGCIATFDVECSKKTLKQLKKIDDAAELREACEEKNCVFADYLDKCVLPKKLKCKKIKIGCSEKVCSRHKTCMVKKGKKGDMCVNKKK